MSSLPLHTKPGHSESAEACRGAGARTLSAIDGDPLDEGGEISEHLDGSIAQPLVVLDPQRPTSWESGLTDARFLPSI
jgi:hypothetical protein